ncbi:hypothetical protein CEXT_560141 [Caerostris extrusa]|uniref:Uncharacterized protein n=1 Tax=Caerostris extrusa TaxID=172846 RepID=A0AAV4XQ63_CAEEX|nr:hypothetical protein CEXT_560141 [Caerostris extrusa]
MTEIHISYFSKTKLFHHEVFVRRDPGLRGVQQLPGRLRRVRPVLSVLLHQPVCIRWQVQRTRHLQLRVPPEIRVRREGCCLRLSRPAALRLRLKEPCAHVESIASSPLRNTCACADLYAQTGSREEALLKFKHLTF